MKCPHCDAHEENIQTVFQADDTTEYAYYACMFCGWEWTDSYDRTWYVNNDDLLVAGMG